MILKCISQVYSPLVAAGHVGLERVLRVIPEEAEVLKSRDRAPILVVFEAAKQEAAPEAKDLPLVPREAAVGGSGGGSWQGFAFSGSSAWKQEQRARAQPEAVSPDSSPQTRPQFSPLEHVIDCRSCALDALDALALRACLLLSLEFAHLAGGCLEQAAHKPKPLRYTPSGSFNLSAPSPVLLSPKSAAATPSPTAADKKLGATPVHKDPCREFLK